MGKYSDYNWLNFRRFICVVSLKLLYFYVVPIFVFYLPYLCLSFAFFFSSALYFYFFTLFFHCFCCFYFPLFRAPSPAHTMSKTHFHPHTQKTYTTHKKSQFPFLLSVYLLSISLPRVLIFLSHLPLYAKKYFISFRPFFSSTNSAFFVGCQA